MRTFLVGLALAGALIACSSTTDVSVAALASLNRHQALWEQRTFTSYSFDLVQEKFGLTSNVHVTVSGTTIVSVIDNATGEPPVVDAGYVTIDDLFALAQSVFGQKSTTLQMEFNEQYGYPTLVAIDDPTLPPARIRRRSQISRPRNSRTLVTDGRRFAKYRRCRLSIPWSPVRRIVGIIHPAKPEKRAHE